MEEKYFKFVKCIDFLIKITMKLNKCLSLTYTVETLLTETLATKIVFNRARVTGKDKSRYLYNYEFWPVYDQIELRVS